MLRVLSLVAFAGIIAACHGHDHQHDFEVPGAYAGRTNPLAGDPAAATAGGTLYTQLCVECHGTEGRGDGVEAAELDPAPADFHEHSFDHGDDYLYWRIAEGGDGDPIQSDMPAWNTELNDQEIWQLVTYMRTLAE